MPGPSIVGSAVIVYPIRPSLQGCAAAAADEEAERLLPDHGCDGGAASAAARAAAAAAPNSHSSSPSSSSSSSSHSSYSHSSAHGPRINYCPSNPCITHLVHRLHHQLLSGDADAEIHLSRCLTVCAFLSQHQGDGCEEDSHPPSSAPPPAAMLVAHIAIDCTCGDPAHQVRMAKRGYVQQFRLPTRCRYVAAGTRDSSGHVSEVRRKAFQPVRIPLASLFPGVQAAMQHGLLPDLGAAFRSVLLRRSSTEQFRKAWVKAAAGMQILPAASTSSSLAPAPAPFAAPLPQGGGHANSNLPATAARMASMQGWGREHPLHLSIASALIHDSIPCIKRVKKHQGSQACGGGSSSGSGSSETVELACCINVLFGTLLKLYERGAKVPTFTSRVAMTARLMQLQCMPQHEQSKFLAENASLVRLCFMEYSLNALQDWLPCEREQLVASCPAMEGYFRVAVCMCDVFR